jgi:hypothetical protein
MYNCAQQKMFTPLNADDFSNLFISEIHRRYYPEDQHRHLHRRENLKPLAYDRSGFVEIYVKCISFGITSAHCPLAIVRRCIDNGFHASSDATWLNACPKFSLPFTYSDHKDRTADSCSIDTAGPLNRVTALLRERKSVKVRQNFPGGKHQF